jgi:hypothetical protein
VAAGRAVAAGPAVVTGLAVVVGLTRVVVGPHALSRAVPVLGRR